MHFLRRRLEDHHVPAILQGCHIAVERPPSLVMMASRLLV
jgi:hypothetical protein